MLMATLACMLDVPASAGNQLTSNRGERRKMREMNRSIKDEAKRLKNQNYFPEPGAPAMEFQLRRAFEKEFEKDDQGRNRYVIGVGSAISGIENAARLHAVSDATINAAMLLESKIMGLVENDFNNRLYSRDEFETLSKMAGVFSNMLAQTLPTGVPVTAFVKDHNSHYEYQVRIAYPMEIMKVNSSRVISEILEKENQELRKKFERITGLDKLGE